MTQSTSTTETVRTPPPDPTPDPVERAVRPGRKRDHSLDRQILEAALDVLAETGYDGMTIEAVAARAKAGKATLYRRWPSKDELAIDAAARPRRDGEPAIVESRAGVNRVLIRRSMDRGEISAEQDVDAVGLIVPSMAAYRVLMLHLPVDRDYLVSLVDNVLLPAVGLRT